MGERPAKPAIFTIPVDRAFADALVAGVMASHGGAPLALPAGMLLLPNNRAVTAVRDAFVRHSGGALLLPRLVVLGDEDLDESVGAALDRIDDDADAPPPAIRPMRRRFVLARLIQEERPEIAVGEALRLADGLGRVIDALAIEEVPLSMLTALDSDGGMAGHWEQAFALLQRLAARWPEILAQEGAIDRAQRRNLIYGATARRWRDDGLPAPFVIAAGITSTAPAIARLLRTIAFARGGAVVLPHFDGGMDDGWWAALGEDPARGEEGARAPLDSHPYLHLKILLDRMGVAREEVDPWPEPNAALGVGGGPASRRALVRNLFAPAAFTADWAALRPGDRSPAGISVVECANPAEEALAIALAMRETLETPGRTAALVTPDRAIATRVAGHLARWGIVADDSAGQPLVTTPAGELLLALADAAASDFAPVELIALLSHPYVATEARLPWLDRVRELDLVLRGPRPAAGLAMLDALLRGRALEPKAGTVERAARAELHRWWSAAVMPLLSTLSLRFASGASVDLATLLATLRETLSALAEARLWTGAAGRALAQLFEALEGDAGELTAPIDPRELVPMLSILMRDVAVRPPQGGHPRLFIWGLIEARLQRADRMILAGLNEGQWPQPPSPDPWLAPMMRRRLGLPGVDRPSGLSAHDFATALGAGEVLITRAARQGTSPTVASRLLLRLEALVGTRIGDAAGLAATADALDRCDTPAPIARPAPTPARAYRPRKLSVTEVDTLLADPFAFYMRSALALRPLDGLDAEPTPAWRGTLVHDVLERWLKGGASSVDAVDALLDEALERPSISPLLRALWAPRLRPALRWAVEEIVGAANASGRRPIVPASEARGAMEIDGVTLSGKADRIDRLADGSLAVVDYKTGSSPAKRSVDSLYALQLGLIGMMAQEGAFADTGGPASGFEYWRTNRQPKGDGFGWTDTPFLKREARVDESNFVALARERLREGIARWLNGDEAFKAKLAPEFAPYADYDQLMRLEEWFGREGPGA